MNISTSIGIDERTGGKHGVLKSLRSGPGLVVSRDFDDVPPAARQMSSPKQDCINISLG